MKTIVIAESTDDDEFDDHNVTQIDDLIEYDPHPHQNVMGNDDLINFNPGFTSAYSI